MRALIIDDESKAVAARVVEYAKAHPWNPFPGRPGGPSAVCKSAECRTP